MTLHHLTTRQKVTVMLAVGSGLFLAALDQTIVATALPRIVTDLHGLDHLSWVVTAYLLTSTITVPISGKLSDIYGRRRLLLIGIAVFVGGSMLAGLSQNMTELIAFRALQGVGAGLLMSNTFAVIGDLFPPLERGRWQGLFGGIFGIASVVGPLLGGWLTDHASWRWNFYINVPVGIAAFFLIMTYFPTITSGLRKRIDYLGASLLGTGLTALLLALVWGGSQFPWGSTEVIGAFIAALVLLTSFILVERGREHAILPPSLFRNSIFRVSAIVTFFIGLAMFGGILYLPLFAQDVLGFSATNSGIILTPMVFGLIVASVGSGQLTSRTGRYKTLAILGTLITVLGLFWLSRMDPTTTRQGLIERMIFLGFGLGISMPIFNVIVQNAFPQSELGVVTSSVQLFRSVGSTVGVAVMGTVLNNSLMHKLAGIPSGSTSGASLDVNHLQAILSPAGQTALHTQIAKLPSVAQSGAQSQLMGFLSAVKDVLASSITEVFLIAAALSSVAFIATWFLHEIPLRRSAHPGPTSEDSPAPALQT